MKIFSSLKQDAINFLEPYKTKEPATYAAAEQALGAILMTDGFIGINNPFGRKQRRGIFGTIGGIILGVILMFVPTIFGNLSGINSMTATTSATIVSVGPASYTRSAKGSSGSSCPLTASYSVNGQAYTQQSAINSSSYCSLTPGQVIIINYNPSSPGAWVYGAKTISYFLQIFFWTGVLFLISSIITFFIRLFSIIFGWKLLKDGRKNAANLPAGTNLETMIEEIKRNFISSIFGFGGAQGMSTPPNITGIGSDKMGL
jgi:hypothetical protein